MHVANKNTNEKIRPFLWTIMEMKDLTKYLPTLRLLIASTITFIIFQTPTTAGMAEEETDDVLYLLALNHVLAGIEDKTFCKWI